MDVLFSYIQKGGAFFLGQRLTFDSIFENIASSADSLTGISIVDTAVSLLIAFILGALIFFVYKKCFNGVVYNNSFNMSLAIMVMLTAVIIITISSNIVLSLGMVGALSIVRYRTAIKDPLDLMFLFWSITTGIIIGAGEYAIALLCAGSVILCLFLFGLFKPKDRVYIVVIHYSGVSEASVRSKLGKIKYTIKSRVQRSGLVELTLEVMLKPNGTGFIEAISETEGVTDVSLIQYNGEYID